jgi:hypothetical protein
LVRQNLIDAMAGIQFTVWYEWKEGPFGLIDAGKERQAMTAAKVLIKTMTGFAYQERLPLDSELDFVLRFTDDAGKTRYTVWTSPESGASPDDAKAHAISFPVEGSSVQVIDVMGGEPKQIPVVDGRLTIEISGSPQYVLPMP